MPSPALSLPERATERQVRHARNKLRTPLLQQTAPPEQAAMPTQTIMHTSLGAAIEAFYRSALNSRLNTALTGVKGPLFPDMHVQLPLRGAPIGRRE